MADASKNKNCMDNMHTTINITGASEIDRATGFLMIFGTCAECGDPKGACFSTAQVVELITAHMIDRQVTIPSKT